MSDTTTKRIGGRPPALHPRTPVGLRLREDTVLFLEETHPRDRREWIEALIRSSPEFKRWEEEDALADADDCGVDFEVIEL